MTHTIKITDELSAYFCDKQTEAAVNFVAKSSSNWTDLSVNEFERKENSKYDFKGYENYSDAWLYSKKVQKDFFDFLAKVWALSWGKLIFDSFSGELKPVSFGGVEEVWKEDRWSREFNIKPEAHYDELWLYCEYDRSEKNTHEISLQLSLGNDGDYKMQKPICPSSWNNYDKKDDNYFFKNFSFIVKGNNVEMSDMGDAMAEMKGFFANEVFKT